MKTFTALSIACVLAVSNVVLSHSAAWGACTAQERIELGNQGYDKDEVQKACTEGGEDFWDSLSKELATGLASGLTKGLNQALGIRDSNATSAQSAGGASACVTNAGTCPLSGGQVGYPCYCQAWNGATFTGFSR
jgi:hypothetical protein